MAGYTFLSKEDAKVAFRWRFHIVSAYFVLSLNSEKILLLGSCKTPDGDDDK